MSSFVKLLTSLILFVSWVSSAHANKLPSVESYAALPEVSLARVSLDGKLSAYRYIQEDKDYLVIMDLTSGELLSAADVSELNPSDLFFIDNNRIVLKAYQSSRRSKVGAAFLYDLKSKKIRQLLKAEKGVAGSDLEGEEVRSFLKGEQGGIKPGQAILDADYSRIVGLQADENKILMPAYYKRPETNRKQTGAHKLTLMAVDLSGERSARPASRSELDSIDFFVDADGELLVQELFSDEKDLHRIEVRKDNEWVEIFSEATPELKKEFVGLTPDRTKLVFLDYGESGNKNYYTLALADGKINGPVLSKPGADIEKALTDIQRVVYGVEYAGFYPSYAFFDQKQTATYEAIKNALPDKHALTIVDFHPGWKDIVFHIEGPEVVSQYLLFSNNEFISLGDARPQIQAEQFNPIEVTEYKARDGLSIPTLLTYPKAKEKTNLPTILLAHPGPQEYDSAGFNWLVQYFASRGYLVIQPQFRGSDGFGEAHIKAGYGQWGRKMQDDLTDAVNHFVKAGSVNKDKVCIAGQHYGGYAALMGGIDTANQVSCVIAINAMSDLEEMLADETYEHREESSIVYYWEKFMLEQAGNRKSLKSISPIHLAKQMSAPVLLVHGLYDQLVLYKQSVAMNDALKKANKDVEFVTIKGEGDQLASKESRLKLLQEVDAFLQKHM